MKNYCGGEGIEDEDEMEELIKMEKEKLIADLEFPISCYQREIDKLQKRIDELIKVNYRLPTLKGIAVLRSTKIKCS